jgi:3-phenylpropionate/cinnamic acid dioxygenase small subunit
MAAREQQISAFTRHVVTNIIFGPASDGAVSVTYILTLFRSDDETRSAIPAFVADVAETWANEGQNWKLAERTISPAFSHA